MTEDVYFRSFFNEPYLVSLQDNNRESSQGKGLSFYAKIMVGSQCWKDSKLSSGWWLGMGKIESCAMTRLPDVDERR